MSASRTTQSRITNYAVSKKTKKSQDKKILTKGAMKVFEGLKVSIPKEGLDMKEVLSCSPTSKRLELEAEQENINADKKLCREKEKNVKHDPLCNKSVHNFISIKKPMMKCGNKLGLKITKNKFIPDWKSSFNAKINSLSENEKKSHDIYDFEETQDSIDVFSKCSNSLPVYQSFRNKLSDNCINPSKSMLCNEKTPPLEICNNEDDANSNCEYGSHTENICNEEKSSFNSPSIVVPPSKKINVHKSITKNKCMIMGRIFKNAIKSKMGDDIKDIPPIENSKIVEDYVQNCRDIQSKHDSIDKEHKLSEEEMNILFDNLLKEEKQKNVANKNRDKNHITEHDANIIISSTVVKNFDNKSKLKVNRCKKRQRGSSPGSSDEEFSIKKIPKKNSNRKSSSNNECVINLEQELKECIGVASRKSQRKCTSGKQNVLVEYWSSDESNFDVEQNIAATENMQNINHPLEQDIVTISPSQNYSNDNVIMKDEKQRNESTIVSLEIGMCDTNSNNEKEKQKQIWNVQSQKLSSPHSTNKNILITNKNVENCASDDEIVDSQTIALRRQKRTAVDTLYYWSSSSEDELQDVIEIKPLREEYDDEDRPLQQGWIVGDSPKKLVTMLAQAKGKKMDAECVKKNRKKRTSV